MIRLNRCRRIGSSGIKARRDAPGRTMAAALAATFAVLAIGGVSSLAPIGAALAQTAGTAGPVSLGDLFKDDDSVELRDGAAEKLREAGAQTFHPRGGCAEKAKFKVIVKRGDPLFQPALAAARRDVLKAVLADMPQFSWFEFSYEVGSKADVQVDYDRMPDREKPKLHTSSVPPKGSKVKPGDQIKVTMVARDDATRWQTGIQRIQLMAQNPGGDELVGAQDYPPVIRPNCESRPEPRTLVLTYTVPRNPPPIVRLRAIAEDFANHHDTDVGEFPTGDWYGTFKWIHLCTGVTRDETHGIADLTLDYDGRGNLTGTLAGSTPQRSMSYPGCSSFVMGHARDIQRKAGRVLHADAEYIFSPSRRRDEYVGSSVLLRRPSDRVGFRSDPSISHVRGRVPRSAPPTGRQLEIGPRWQTNDFGRWRYLHDHLFADSAAGAELTWRGNFYAAPRNRLSSGFCGSTLICTVSPGLKPKTSSSGSARLLPSSGRPLVYS